MYLHIEAMLKTIYNLTVLNNKILNQVAIFADTKCYGNILTIVTGTQTNFGLNLAYIGPFMLNPRTVFLQFCVKQHKAL